MEKLFLIHFNYYSNVVHMLRQFIDLFQSHHNLSVHYHYSITINILLILFLEDLLGLLISLLGYLPLATSFL